MAEGNHVIRPQPLDAVLSASGLRTVIDHVGLPAVFTIAALAIYGVCGAASTVFYARLDASPDDVSLGYVALVSRAGLGALTILTAVAAATTATYLLVSWAFLAALPTDGYAERPPGRVARGVHALPPLLAALTWIALVGASLSRALRPTLTPLALLLLVTCGFAFMAIAFTGVDTATTLSGYRGGRWNLRYAALSSAILSVGAASCGIALFALLNALPPLIGTVTPAPGAEVVQRVMRLLFAFLVLALPIVLAGLVRQVISHDDRSTPMGRWLSMRVANERRTAGTVFVAGVVALGLVAPFAIAVHDSTAVLGGGEVRPTVFNAAVHRGAVCVRAQPSDEPARTGLFLGAGPTGLLLVEDDDRTETAGLVRLAGQSTTISSSADC